MRQELVEKYKDEIALQRMDFHIELIRQDENPTIELLVNRAQILEGKKILIEMKNLKKAKVIKTPYIEGYGETHITLAYFPKGIPEDPSPYFFHSIKPWNSNDN